LRAADIVWTNTAGGNWGVAANWQPNAIPGPSDSVWITNNGTYTNTLNVTSTVATLTLGGASGVQILHLQGPNKLTLTGAGLGKTTNGIFRLAGRLDLPGSLVLNGPLVWREGGGIFGSGSVRLNGVSSIEALSNIRLSGCTLVNAGVLNWSGGFLNTTNGTVISNAPAAVIDIRGDVDTKADQGDYPGLFLNAGLLRKSVGTAPESTRIRETFHNSGVVELLAGQLFLDAGSSSSGSNWVGAGATLGFMGGTNRLGASSAVAGPGNVQFESGYTDIGGRYAVTGTNTVGWYGSNVFRRPGLTLNALKVAGVNAMADFLTGENVSLQRLELANGMVGGTDDLTITTNALLWNGGGFQGSGRVSCHAGIVMNGISGMDLLGRTVVNHGLFAWNDGMLTTGLGSVLSNAPGGTVLIADAVGGTLAGPAPRGTIVNAGWMQKIGTNTHLTYFSDNFLNQGTLEVEGGWFRCWQTFTNAAGLTRLFAGSIFELRAGGLVAGGVLEGDGLVVGAVTNSAVVSPGRPLGRLTIDGNYIQTAAGTLAIDLGGSPPTLYDRLQITNTSRSATLAGTVRATLVDDFMPVSNDVFTVLTVAPGTRSGTFSSLAHRSFLAMTAEYTATNASLRVTNVAPAPMLRAPAMAWGGATTDIGGNTIWRLYPKLTWPAMAGTQYRLLHTTNVASTNWSVWPADSGPPLHLPEYITATGSVMTVEGPAIGLRIRPPLSLEFTTTIEPAHFYRLEFGP